MDATPEALLDAAGIDRLRTAFEGYTTDAVDDLLGPIGRSALQRGDLAGVHRELRDETDRLATLVRLFLLGQQVDAADAAAALAPLDLAAAGALVGAPGAGSHGSVRALLDVRPYSEDGGEPWWVFSDFGSDVRPGPLGTEHVLGIGAAALTLARATPREPVGRALDIGTGCGVQALHLSRHAGQVCATDISGRALRLAATSAALAGLRPDLRQGSFLEPVRGELFDLVVANPPFIVSAGAAEFDYRDSGMAGDGVSRHLVSGIPGLLNPGGTGQLLANWIIPTEGDWRERVLGWVAGRGCDAWVWQREIAEPGEYVALWLRDAGFVPGTPQWTQRYDAWLDWMSAAGVAAVGMGMVTLWRTDAEDPVLVAEDVPQELGQPVGPHLPGWVARQRLVRDLSDAELLALPLRPDTDLVRTTSELVGPDGWATARTTLRQSHGLRWELETDAAVGSLIAACAAAGSLALPVELLALTLDADLDDVTAAVLPAVRDLVGRGLLVPDER